MKEEDSVAAFCFLPGLITLNASFLYLLFGFKGVGCFLIDNGFYASITSELRSKSCKRNCGDTKKKGSTRGTDTDTFSRRLVLISIHSAKNKTYLCASSLELPEWQNICNSRRRNMKIESVPHNLRGPRLCDFVWISPLFSPSCYESSRLLGKLFQTFHSPFILW